MRVKGVKRILALSTVSYNVAGETFSWPFSILWHSSHFLIPQADAEMWAIANAVCSQSDLEWTVFRVKFFSEGASDLKVFSGFLYPDSKGGLTISRKSMGKWILEEIYAGKWIRQVPALAN